MKKYIQPSIKVLRLEQENLGPGAGDVSDPHVGNARETEFADDSFDAGIGTSLWDE